MALGLVDEVEVAELREMTVPSLRNERTRGLGPPYQRIGRKVFYPLPELRKFLAASTVVPAGPAATLISGLKRRRRVGSQPQRRRE